MAKQSLSKPSPHFKDLTGQTFNRLTVLFRVANSKAGQARWRCRCTCGSFCDVLGVNLRNNNTSSCGCWRVDNCRQLRTKHGAAPAGHQTVEYITWTRIKGRTMNPRNADYKRYGQRGIKICAGWAHSFASFLADMKARPSPQHSIERCDNAGNYSCGHCAECLTNGWPANCCWADRVTQANNTRRNHLLTFKGETRSIAQWEKHFGFASGVVSGRIQYGWSVPKALTTPSRKSKTS